MADNPNDARTYGRKVNRPLRCAREDEIFGICFGRFFKKECEGQFWGLFKPLALSAKKIFCAGGRWSNPPRGRGSTPLFGNLQYPMNGGRGGRPPNPHPSWWVGGNPRPPPAFCISGGARRGQNCPSAQKELSLCGCCGGWGGGVTTARPSRTALHPAPLPLM